MNARYRVATADERSWYEMALYPLQNRVCATIGALDPQLVLTGGTTLARVYLDHRYSDDLDIFTTGPVAPLARAIVDALEGDGHDVELRTPLGAFVRMTIVAADIRLQLDIATDHRRLDAPIFAPSLGINVPTLRDLAGNKLVAFEDRREIKDAIDLFFLRKTYTWSEFFAAADEKRVPLDYVALHHAMRAPLVGSALLTHEIDDDAFTAFQRESADAIRAQVKKKTTELSATSKTIIHDILWDTPREDRTINAATRRIIKTRARALPLPERLVIRAALDKPESNSP